MTVGDVEEALSEDHNLAELWLERGRGQHVVERDRLHACAEFIVRYVEFIHDVVKRQAR